MTVSDARLAVLATWRVAFEAERSGGDMWEPSVRRWATTRMQNGLYDMNKSTA